MGWKRGIRAVAYMLLLTFVCAIIATVLFLRLPLIKTETVSFQNGDVTLAGTLLLPRSGQCRW